MGCTRCADVVWKLECTEKEVDELKRQRQEDAKANEKVACIYATQEQAWFGERNRLRLQIKALLNQLSIFEKRRAECVESLTGKIKDLEDSLTSNQRILEEELNKNKAFREELNKAEKTVEELRKAAASKADEHAAAAWKHKTAFVRLVSAHRQLEAELGRAFREVEVGKAELSLILEQKVEAVSIAQKLSLEVENLHKEVEQKYETGSQKHSLRSMCYKHRNPSIKSWQTQSKTYERQNAEEKKYRSTLEQIQMHHLEVNAFAEQIRLRDEKIESLHWRHLRYEIESEQFHAHLEELNQEKAQLRQVNLKLEEQLLDYEAELHYLNHSASKRSSEESITEGKPAENQKQIKMGLVTKNEKEVHQADVRIDEKAVMTEKMTDNKTSHCTWKMDIQALGVFHKVKRLKQQLMMLERFTTQLKSVKENYLEGEKRTYLALMSLLNKQVARYESLQAKIDELCNRMNEETDQNGNHVRPTLKRKTKEEIKALERYLQEALQLQRYMVAAGQKLAELQTGISDTFHAVAHEVEKISSIDMSRFACSMKDLLKEVQKGLEIQSSRIIGDLEGTLACDGIIHLRSLP